tara:strand:+ start:6597 stop:6701 length:105 start_codon:yes stop_codon:yes gene_type:complete
MGKATRELVDKKEDFELSLLDMNSNENIVHAHKG